jgi:hypothetical protein
VFALRRLKPFIDFHAWAEGERSGIDPDLRPHLDVEGLAIAEEKRVRDLIFD